MNSPGRGPEPLRIPKRGEQVSGSALPSHSTRVSDVDRKPTRRTGTRARGRVDLPAGLSVRAERALHAAWLHRGEMSERKFKCV